MQYYSTHIANTLLLSRLLHLVLLEHPPKEEGNAKRVDCDACDAIPSQPMCRFGTQLTEVGADHIQGWVAVESLEADERHVGVDKKRHEEDVVVEGVGDVRLRREALCRPSASVP
jgi:hypothetical protein